MEYSFTAAPNTSYVVDFLLGGINITSLQIQEVCATLGSMQATRYRYRYNGKEQLSRFAGRYDYGFRMYDAGLARFLSVDPLTKKYPELSPYASVANSPLAFKEIDGRDFELIINHDTREIIVKATYYVLQNDSKTKSLATQAVGVWNSQKHFTYSFKEGEATISYSIKFDLDVKETQDLAGVPLSNAKSGFMGNNIIKNDPNYLANYNSIKHPTNSNSSSSSHTAAITLDGNNIVIDNNTKGSNLRHEIGHTLGSAHLTGNNLMNTHSIGQEINSDVIEDILPMVSKSTRIEKDYFVKIKYSSIGKKSPENFADGKVK